MKAGEAPKRSPAAAFKAMVAFLLREHRITLAEFAELTDRQIHDLYFHPRDEEGRVRLPAEAIPEAPPTLEAELMALDRICAALRVPEDQVAEKRLQLRAKYGAAEGKGDAGT